MDWRDWDALRTARSREWDFGLVYEAITAKKWWLIGLPLAACVLIAGLLCLQPPRYSAETQVLIGPRTAGLIGMRSSLALFGGASGGAVPAAGQAQLIASRDLARRAIKDLRIEGNPEFDPVAQNPGPVSRALIFLGLLRDPARKSPEDRILEAYLDRLQVSAPGGGSLVTINFQSQDRELAAKAANRIAELYLDMRADATPCHRKAARVSFRAPSRRRSRFIQRRPCCSCRVPRCSSWLSAHWCRLRGRTGACPAARRSLWNSPVRSGSFAFSLVSGIRQSPIRGRVENRLCNERRQGRRMTATGKPRQKLWRVSCRYPSTGPVREVQGSSRRALVRRQQYPA